MSLTILIPRRWLAIERGSGFNYEVKLHECRMEFWGIV